MKDNTGGASCMIYLFAVAIALLLLAILILGSSGTSPIMPPVPTIGGL